MFDDPVEELLTTLVPNHPVFVYALPTALLGAALALLADPIPYLAVGVGVVLRFGLSIAYERTGLQQESSEDRSTADWLAVGVFLFVVVGAVVVAEADAVSVRAAPTQFVGVLTGLLASAAVIEWLYPAIRARVGMR